MGTFRDLDVAEEATQEAFAIATDRWPRDGMPRNPGAWLVTTARNRAIDRLRHERTLAAKAPIFAVPQTAGEDGDMHDMDDSTVPDERLELIFMCCHPALAAEAQVALTLRALAGLTTDEIARAFLVSSDTMKRRLSRAKAKITATAIPFRLPPDHQLAGRLAAVLAVVYLIFNEGYAGRGDLASEAIRLARVLADLMPAEPEVHGLVALVLCHDARSQARFTEDEIVVLSEQDRGLWDTAQIAAGRDALDCALRLGGRGAYVLQAAIASLQCDDPIDWPQVVALYGDLAQLARSPVVELNRAVAIAEAGAPAAALEIVDQLVLDDYPYLHSTRAELLRRLGRVDEARTAYRRAMQLTPSPRHRRVSVQRLGLRPDPLASYAGQDAGPRSAAQVHSRTRPVALEFSGGVPRVSVPDRTRTGHRRSCQLLGAWVA